MNKNIMKKITALASALAIAVSVMPFVSAELVELGSQALGDVVYSEEKGIYVIGGRFGAVYSSADGENWVKRDTGITTTIGGNGSKSIDYSEKAGAFLIAPASKCLLYSTDSVNWTKIAADDFQYNVNTVEAIGDYVYASDVRGNIFKAKYDDLETFTEIEHEIKDKQWRGGCAYGDKIFFYSTAAWDTTCQLALYEGGEFVVPEVEKLSQNNIHRYYDMIYSEEIGTFILLYAVDGNNYKDSYIAVYEDGKFKTVGTVVSCGFSIAETDDGFVIGTLTSGKLYEIAKDKIKNFSASDIKEIKAPEEIQDTERFFNIASGESGIVIIGGYNGNIVFLDKDMNVKYIKEVYDTQEATTRTVSGIDDVIYRGVEEDVEEQLLCTTFDQGGIVMPGGENEILWSVKHIIPEEAAEGISVDENGVIKVSPLSEYELVSFTVFGEGEGFTVEKAITAKKPQTAGSMEISGESEVAIPITEDEAAYTFSAAVFDTEGAEIKDARIEWSVTEAAGLAIDDGVLTVGKDAKEGDYTIKAVFEYLGITVEAEYKINLKLEDVPTDAVWKEETVLFIPKEEEAQYPFTVEIKNQKGNVYATADSVEASDGEYPEGVKYEKGIFIVSSAAQPGSFNVTVKKGESFEKSLTLQIGRLSVEIEGETKTDIKGKNTTLTYTASAKDDNQKAVDAVFEWSVSDGACNIDEDGKLHIPSTIKSGTEVEVTASVKNLAKETITLTVNNTKKTYSSSSSGGGGGGGGGGVVIAPSTAIVPTETVVVPSDEEIEDNKAFPFTDMENTAWAKEAVKALFDKGIVTGVNETSFEPQRNITRAEFIKMLCDMLSINDTQNPPKFTDCTESDWYYSYVVSAYNAGIVKGMGSDFFGARLPLSRQDMAKMIEGVLLNRKVKLAEGTDFADMTYSDSYAVESVRKLIATGVLSGDSDGNFRPKDNTTRAEAAVVINKLGGYIK